MGCARPAIYLSSSLSCISLTLSNSRIFQDLLFTYKKTFQSSVSQKMSKSITDNTNAKYTVGSPTKLLCKCIHTSLLFNKYKTCLCFKYVFLNVCLFILENELFQILRQESPWTGRTLKPRFLSPSRLS